MKEIRVKIVGTSPLLMNRRPPDFDEVKVKKNEKTIDSTTDAINKSHYDEILGFYIPGDMIEASVKEAGKQFKIGRGTAKKVVSYSVFVQEEKIPLNKKIPDISIDKRWATHPSTGNSVAANRVRFDNWNATFTVQVDEERIDIKTVESMFKEAGKIVGIGSYRPKFGRFEVKSFEIVK